MKTFERLESEVRSYSRHFPAVFERASGSFLYDEAGREYLDFFCGAGALNYGHNEPRMVRRVVRYLLDQGILHGLDMSTTAKRDFLLRFEEVILRPRGLPYRVQFTGPTGTNAVEAALKLARKVTGRGHVVHFKGAYHGLTLGSLAVSGDSWRKRAAGVPLTHTATAAFDGDLGPGEDTTVALDAQMGRMTQEGHAPAAVIVETIQAEGGVKVASYAWLARVAEVARRHGALLIVDDIQVGCGRTGPFFSFEPAGVVPDVVCLSKSIGGLGLPMSLVLLRPEHDRWQPGEHNGTFRGNNAAFVAATEALSWWENGWLAGEVIRKGAAVRSFLDRMAAVHAEAEATVRGRGLIHGIEFADPLMAERVSRIAFLNGLIVETCGPEGRVVKLLPALTIRPAELELGFQLLEESIALASDLTFRGARLAGDELPRPAPAAVAPRAP